MSSPVTKDFVVEDVAALTHSSNFETGIKELIYKGEQVIVEDTDRVPHDSNLGTKIEELVVGSVGEAVEIQA